MENMGPIVLLTDFGQRDGYVGVMKGVIAGIAPNARVIDLSHDLPPQDLAAARFVLWNQHRFFPDGSVFVCVVDPGVGTARPIIAVKTRRHFFLAPDNGLLDLVLTEERPETILRVENPAFFRTAPPSRTFHGRDIFAPAAAHLLAGEVYTQLGPFHDYRVPPSPFVEAVPAASGSILHIDRFGNLISSLKQTDWEPGYATLADHRIPRAASYGSVAEGELLLLRGSHGLWEIALRNGSAANVLGGRPSVQVSLHP